MRISICNEYVKRKDADQFLKKAFIDLRDMNADELSCVSRLDGRNMLELLRGKRLVFVGDSLNRNMWESLICILKNFVKDPSKVYEASGKRQFRSDPHFSFVFKVSYLVD